MVNDTVTDPVNYAVIEVYFDDILMYKNLINASTGNLL